MKVKLSWLGKYSSIFELLVDFNLGGSTWSSNIVFWYCLAIISVNFKKNDVVTGQLVETIAEVQQYILIENVFPTRQEQQKYLEKLISKYPHKDDVSDLRSRVCILYLVYLNIIWIFADISYYYLFNT